MIIPIEQLVALDGAYELGHHVGEVLNDTLVQPLLDHEQAGSGHWGDVYRHEADHLNHWLDDHHISHPDF